MIKRLRRAILLVLLLAAMAITAHAQSASEYVIEELSIRLNRPGAQACIEIEGTPGSLVSVQLILPGEDVGDVYTQDDLMAIFAGLDTVEIPASGKAVYKYTAGDAAGLYTFRVSGEVTNVKYTADDNAVPKAEPQEFFTVSWSGGYGSVNDYVQPPVWIRSYMVGDGAPIYGKIIADRMNRLQPGRRYMYIHMDVLDILSEGEMILWQQDKVEQLAELLDEFFCYFYEAGGTIDAIYTDNEQVMNTWIIRDYRKSGETVAQAVVRNINSITDDPYYHSHIRPMLVERGFNFAKNTDAGKHELYDVGIYTAADKAKKGDCNYLIWDAVSDEYKKECLTKAVYEPARKYFPDVYYANYQSNARIAATYDTTVHKYELGGDRTNAGTHSSPVLYEGGSGTPYSEVKGLADSMRGIMLASPSGKTMPWVVSKGYHKFNYIKNDTPYFYEYLFHIAMCNPEALLFYGPRYYTTDPVDRVNLNFVGMQEALEEFNGVADKSDAATLIENNVNTNYFMFSGMYTGGRNLWRITYDNTVVSKEDFVTTYGDTIIFSANGETLTFAGGTMLDNQYSEYGFWVETDADVYPTLTYDEVPEDCTITYRYYDRFGIELDSGFDWKDVYTVAVYNDGLIENVSDRVMNVARYDGNSLASVKPLESSVWTGKSGRMVSFNIKNFSGSKLLTWESMDTLTPLMPALPWNYKQ